MNRITGLQIIVASIIAFSLIVIGGCSSSQSNPVTALGESPEISLPVNNENPDNTNHKLSGTWNATFDIQTLTAVVAPDRTLNAHWNVTSLLPTPLIVVTGYDSLTEVIDVDVTIVNPFDIDVHDVRLIIYTDSTGNRLMNPDNWIGLYDIPGGLPVNPFKAYATDVYFRLFEAFAEHTCDLSIHIPGGNASVKFAIAASYPGNDEEPWKIYLPPRVDRLTDEIGASAIIEAHVYDNQHNVDSVELYCSAITGEMLVPFNHDPQWDVGWELELVNTTGASEGEYPAWVLASSGSSISLYEPLIINVYPAGDYPYHPEVIGKYDPFYYDTFDVCVQDEYAYVLEGDPDRCLMKIVDISDPSNPAPMGYVKPVPHYTIICINELAVQGDYVYAPAFVYEFGYGDKNEFIVIDVSDPWNPAVVGKYYLGETYYRIESKGDYIYLVAQNHILILNVSDPTNPQYYGETEITSCRDLDIQDDYLYVASGYHFYVYDITIPFYPILVGDLNTVPFSGDRLSVHGDYAVFLESNGDSFKVLNISDPTDPYEVATEELFYNGKGVDMAGDYAYVACMYDGMRVYDISNPSDPVLAGTIETTKAEDVYVEGNIVYVADRTGGLRVVDVTNPAAPSLTGRIKKAHQEHIDVIGDYAYVADGEFGCTIYDISNSESPKIFVSYDMPKTTDIKVIGDYAYIIGKKFLNLEYLFIMDFSDPFNPIEIGSVNLGANTLESLQIDGTYAYVCAGTGGLNIIDISVPGSPALVYTVSITDAKAVTIEGDFAYVVSFYDGLLVVNISDPSNPLITGSVATSDYPRDVTVKNDYAYIADYHDGLSVVNISNPYDPQHIISVEIYHMTAYSVSISGNYAYVGCSGTESGALTVFDITDPSNPEIFSTADNAAGRNEDIQVIDNLAYMVGPNDGLKIVELW